MSTRRAFLVSSAASSVLGSCRMARPPAAASGAEPIIDVHQHLPFNGRTGDELRTHQELMGVTHTVLLPAGSVVVRPSTMMGKANGLYTAATDPNPTSYEFAQKHRPQFSFFANEVPDLPQAKDEIEKYL